MATKWGIISAGKISNDFVCAMKVLPQDEQKVIGVAARDKQRAEEFAKKHNIPFSYGSYDELLNNSDIDVVYVGVLHPQHYEVAKLCLEHDKSVLCEKPLCMNLKQTEKLIQIAKKRKLFLMEAVWSRFFPLYHYIRKILKEKSIGEPLYLDVHFGAKIDVDRIWKKELGGGTVLDIGIYTLQMATLVFPGLPSIIKAVGHLNKEGVDESMSCVLSYPSGATATLSSHCKIEMPNTATIIGTKGSILVHKPFWAPTKITVSGDTGKIVEEKEFLLPDSTDKFNFRNSVGLNYEAVEVHRCLKEGLKESPLMTHEDSMNLAKLEDEIRQQLGVIYPSDDHK